VKNADHEFPIYFSVIDENLSWYLDENIKRSISGSVDKEDEDFIESNKMNGINGRIFGNLKGLSMVKGQAINWYLLSLGTEVDMHNVHFHGQTVLAVSQREFLRLQTLFNIFCSVMWNSTLPPPSGKGSPLILPVNLPHFFPQPL
jgi:hypothetical protein